MDAVPTVTPAAEAAAADELLGAMRWTATGIDQVRVMRGHTRRIRGCGIRFVYVADGSATLAPSDCGENARPADALELTVGDFVLLTRGGNHELRAQPDHEARLVTGTLTLDAAPFDRVVELMPPLLFSCFQVREPVYGALLTLIHAEVDDARPGGTAVLSRLVDLVVSAALRSWLEHGCGSAHAWLTRLRDPHLGRALDAIHSDPGEPWTVESLARIASASRSQFAERFRSTVGESPARYLARVRMRRAEELLLAGQPVSRVAFTLGYVSDEGFRRAFQRHSGLTPSAWRRDRPGSAVTLPRPLAGTVAQVPA